MDIGYMTRRITSPLNTLEPDRCALKLENELEWSYSDLHYISNAYANALRTLGVKKGDRVGILLFNCLEYFALYFAISKIGAIAVRLNFRLSSEEIEYAINDSGTTVLCFHSSLKEKLEPIRDSVCAKDYISLEYGSIANPDWAKDWRILEGGNRSEVQAGVNLSDPVMLMYTSGTTGRPKGALWSHDNTFWFSTMQIMKWNLSSASITMTTGPLYHVGAMEDAALPTLLRGGTVIITKSGGFKIEKVLDIVEKERVTDLMLFPFMIYDMMHNVDLKQYKLSSVRTIYSGGDPVRPWVINQLNGYYPHLGFVQVYGLTEGTPVAASLDPEDAEWKAHTVGKPMPLTEIKIVNDMGQPVSEGKVGEICIKSPAVSVGYWQKPEANAETFIDGWCHTGDLGQIDQDGFLIISGRKKDMIRSGGENIYAAEIENVVMNHPEVKDVAVIGVPDSKYIEAVCAVVIAKERSAVLEESIINYCKNRLASYKKPRKVVFVGQIPRTPSGKIQKYILRNRYRTALTEFEEGKNAN
jgi:fatty-acyl-CoA synthase